jgi:hypothetical protein
MKHRYCSTVLLVLFSSVYIVPLFVSVKTQYFIVICVVIVYFFTQQKNGRICPYDTDPPKRPAKNVNYR